jgi:hypothetical protein
MMTKRGQPNKVDGAFMSRCNAFGISPFENETRMNLRTVTGGTRERLQKKADERHEWVLKSSREQVGKLTRQIEDERYTTMLEKEAIVMRAQRQRHKDRDALQDSECRQKKLQYLVTAAECANKELDRQVRLEAKENEKSWKRSEKADGLIAKMRMELNEQCDEEKRLQVELELVGKKEKELETRLETMGIEYRRKCDELKHVQGQFANWKALDIKQRVTQKKRQQRLQSELDATAKVSSCSARVPNILCWKFIIFFVFPCSFFCGSN